MIIDSHCHVHDPVFADVREMVRTALTYDVWGVVGAGCDVASNAATLRAAAAMPKAVWAALGFHPDWPHLTDEELERVEAQVAEHHARIVAIGEIGLPWYSLEDAEDAAGRQRQGEMRFDRLLRLAVRFDLPVVLHAPHDAAAPAFDALRRHGIERAMFHWHKAPDDVTRAIVDAGYLISVTPEVIYRERDRAMVDAVPLDALLVESDGPWAYRGEFQGLPSGPWLASRVAEEIAKIKQLPVDEVMFRVTNNACRIFHLQWL